MDLGQGEHAVLVEDHRIHLRRIGKGGAEAFAAQRGGAPNTNMFPIKFRFRRDRKIDDIPGAETLDVLRGRILRKERGNVH